jgi:hypothetical protein
MENTEISEAESLVEARELLADRSFGVALVDVRLGPEPQNRDGLALVGEIR